MRETELRKLIRLVEESDIESLEIRRFFRTIKISKRRSENHNGSSQGHHRLAEVPLPAPSSPPQPGPVPVPDASRASGVSVSDLVEIKAPMVGTFYSAPAPGSPPFVQVNKVVAPGDVLCIIEAMKLMNEIEAERGGRIARILVEDGQPIEFGQPLFLLDPAA